jgi:hypothetical protein
MTEKQSMIIKTLNIIPQKHEKNYIEWNIKQKHEKIILNKIYI